MAQLGGYTLTECAEVRLVRVERRMNDHRAMTVRVVETGELRTVVDYASSDVETALSTVSEGTTLPLKMGPAPGRGNSWVVLGS